MCALLEARPGPLETPEGDYQGHESEVPQLPATLLPGIQREKARERADWQWSPLSHTVNCTLETRQEMKKALDGKPRRGAATDPERKEGMKTKAWDVTLELKQLWGCREGRLDSSASYIWRLISQLPSHSPSQPALPAVPWVKHAISWACVP